MTPHFPLVRKLTLPPLLCQENLCLTVKNDHWCPLSMSDYIRSPYLLVADVMYERSLRRIE